MRNLMRLFALSLACAVAAPAHAETITLSGVVLDVSTTKDPRTRQPYSTPAGETGSVNIVVTRYAGTVYDLTGSQLLLTVRKNGTTNVISRQATIDVAAAGTAHFPLVVADTLALFGPYTYDVWLTDPSGNRYQVVTYSPWTVTQAHGQPGQPVTVPATQNPLAQGPGSVIVWHQTTPWSTVLTKIQNAASAGYGVTLLEVDDGTFSPFVFDVSANLDSVQIVGMGGQVISLFGPAFHLLGTTLNATGTVLRIQSNIFTGPLLFLNFKDSSVAQWNGYTGSMFTLSPSGYAGITVEGGSLPEDTLLMGNGAYSFTQLRYGGELDDATYQAALGATASVDVVLDSTCFIDSPLLAPGITFTTSPTGNAHYGKFFPTTSANWPTPPTTIGGALDAVATAHAAFSMVSGVLTMSPGAASLSLPGAKVGQSVAVAMTTTSPGGVLTSVASIFESTITVADHVQQTGSPVGTTSAALIIVK